eukprot:43054_1
MTLTLSSLRRIVVHKHSAASNSATPCISGQHWLTTGSPIPKCTKPPNKSTHAPSFNASKGHDVDPPPDPPPGGLLPVPGTLGGPPDLPPGGLLPLPGTVGGVAAGGESQESTSMGMVVAALIINMKSIAAAFPIFNQMRCCPLLEMKLNEREGKERTEMA